MHLKIGEIIQAFVARFLDIFAPASTKSSVIAAFAAGFALTTFGLMILILCSVAPAAYATDQFIVRSMSLGMFFGGAILWIASVNPRASWNMEAILNGR